MSGFPWTHPLFWPLSVGGLFRNMDFDIILSGFFHFVRVSPSGEKPGQKPSLIDAFFLTFPCYILLRILFPYLNTNVRSLGLQQYLASISYLKERKVQVDDSKYFDQLCNLKTFVEENRNEEDFVTLLAHEK